MKDLIHTENYRGCTIEIYPSESDSPLTWDNLSRWAIRHRMYNFEGAEDISHIDSIEELQQYVKEQGAVIFKPVCMYDHSGQCLTRSKVDRWDSSFLGYQYITREDLLKNYGKRKVTKKLLTDAERMLDAEFETYDNYIRGNVYGYTTMDKDGEIIDSCGGYLGNYDDDDYIMSEAKASIDHHIKSGMKSHFDQLKAWIKNHVPLTVRKPLAL